MLRLAIRVRREDAELALAELLELAPGGVEEVDHGDVVEYAVYGAPGELPALPDLRARIGTHPPGALVDVSTSEVADDWDERWKQFHQPIEVAGLRVRAPWHDGAPGDLVIDPGQAFGTGAHATTRLCLEALCALEPGGALVDVGTGSGVLAIAAARLGWAPVLALDHDPLSVTAARENAEVNGVDIEVRRFDLRDELVPAAPTVVANLLRPLLEALRFEEPPGTLVASGLLGHEDVAVEGLATTARYERDGWLALGLTRPSS
jgi:ribosomal protein L11 methyltransferase